MDTATSLTTVSDDRNHTCADMTRHAEFRCWERDTPEWVLDALRARPFKAQRKEEDGCLTHYRIVRVANNKYWVGVERDNTLITVIPVGFGARFETPYKWFRKRILNFDVMFKSISRMPISRPPAETQEPQEETPPAPEITFASLNDELATTLGLSA